MKRLAILGFLVCALGCGGNTSVDLGGTGGAAGSSAGGSSTGGSSTGGTGAVGTGGIGAGGVGTGGIGTGGISTGGIGTGGIGTGGIGIGGVGTGGSSGGGGNAAVCASVCQKITAAGCPNEDPYSACASGCQVDLPKYQAQCGSQVSSWIGCVDQYGKVACAPDGQSKILGCDSQLVAFIQCAACIPSSDDDACEACTKQHCCAELETLYKDPAFSSYLSCVMACDTQACIDGCWAKNPGLSQPAWQVNQCQGQKCSAC